MLATDFTPLLLQCICSCPVAYANGPASAPAMAPMMMHQGMPDAMSSDSDADADSSDSSADGSGCTPKPVPTQYEAFSDVSSLVNLPRSIPSLMMSLTAGCALQAPIHWVSVCSTRPVTGPFEGLQCAHVH